MTNALRETLLSFGGSVAADLLELPDAAPAAPLAPPDENNQNAINKPAPAEPKNSPLNRRAKDEPANPRPPPPALKNAPPNPPAVPPPALPPANRPGPRAPAPPAPAAVPLRPNSNVSFVLQPVMPPLYPPRAPHPPHVFPNYYEYSGPWHFYDYDRPPGNVNLNFNVPPKNLVVNGRGPVECRNACRPEGEPVQYAPQQGAGCWIKPTIFYDGFWTEQKVKKWVAEQVEKQFPEDASHKSASPSNGQGDAAPKA